MGRLRPRSQVDVGCRAGFRLSGRATVAGGLSEKRSYVRRVGCACLVGDRARAARGDGPGLAAEMSPDPAEVLGWVSTLPGPVKVGYEAGPTGYGMYRFLNDHGVSCVVGAPSKMHRPHGDRVKTDTRDSELLARLLKLDEFAEITVPSVEQEAARDLFRAREDVRGDLMRARHRLSKLLLRQGIVYTGGHAWTRVHDTWLRAQRFDQPGRQTAYDAAYETVVLPLDRRDRLDAAIETMAADSSYTDIVHRLGCLRGI